MTQSAYILFGGYSRTWTDGPGRDLAGNGQLWKVTVTGGTNASGAANATWTDVSGNLPDIPVDQMMIAYTGRVIMGTDLGVVETTLESLSTGSPQWTRDVNIPVTIATQTVEGPRGGVSVTTWVSRPVRGPVRPPDSGASGKLGQVRHVTGALVRTRTVPTVPESRWTLVDDAAYAADPS